MKAAKQSTLHLQTAITNIEKANKLLAKHTRHLGLKRIISINSLVLDALRRNLEDLSRYSKVDEEE